MGVGLGVGVGVGSIGFGIGGMFGGGVHPFNALPIDFKTDLIMPSSLLQVA